MNCLQVKDIIFLGGPIKIQMMDSNDEMDCVFVDSIVVVFLTPSYVFVSSVSSVSRC